MKYLTRLVMKKLIITGILLLNISAFSFGQIRFTDNPDSSVFLTSDIDNFWKAFADFKKDTTKNPFGKEYIDIGSTGVKGFIPNRIESAEHLYAVVKQKSADYEKIRGNTLRIKEKEKQCRSAFYALKYWYPKPISPCIFCYRCL